NGSKLLRKPDEKDFHLVDIPRYLTPAQTQVIAHSGSGGGWGDPLDRDPARVREDVLEDLVSRESALKDYGVVLTDGLELNVVETEKMREERRRVYTSA